MSQLTELIEKTIRDLKSSGCTVHESIIRLRLDIIVACAKYEESIKRNQKIAESLKFDTAHGHGGNDVPNVIGDMITEPSLTPEQLVKGEWYVLNSTLYNKIWVNTFLFRFEFIKNGTFYTNKAFAIDTQAEQEDCSTKIISKLINIKEVAYIRHATKEEVLKYFPDETFLEHKPSLKPEDMVRGEWYVTNGTNWGMWLLKFDYYSSDKRIYTLNSYCVDSDMYYIKSCYGRIMTDTIRPATKEEVLKYFPNETFSEPLPEPEQVGRWYKYIGDIDTDFTPNKWYFCPSNKIYNKVAFIDKYGNANGFYPFNAHYFDLTNPQLTNPDAESENYINPITN